MTSTNNMQALERRAFQSLMLTSRVKTLEASGLLMVRVAEPIATQLLAELENFVPSRIISRLAVVARAFATFYCFENMARDFVMARLSEIKGGGWWQSIPANIQKRVEDQKKLAEKNQWHEVQADSDMDYIMFGDLASIIIANWNDFEGFFPDQHWVKSRLDDLEKSRNAVMHGRMLAPNEIERLKQYFDDWIDQVG
jgi:hypothetical protein